MCGLGSVVCCLWGRKYVREYGGGIFMPESFLVLAIYVLVLTYNNNNNNNNIY